jgi:hypothetical protein
LLLLVSPLSSFADLTFYPLVSLGYIRRDKIDRLPRTEFYHNMDWKPIRIPAEHQASLALWVTFDDPARLHHSHHVGNGNAVFEAFRKRMIRNRKRSTLHEGTDLLDLHITK